VKTPDISTFDRSIILERAKNLLEPKRDHLMSQCARIGLYSEQLKTQDLIQLFYNIYNSEAEGQKMSDSRSYVQPIVQGTFDESIFGNVRGESPEHVNDKAPVAPAAPVAEPATVNPPAPVAEVAPVAMPTPVVPEVVAPQPVTQVMPPTEAPQASQPAPAVNPGMPEVAVIE
jgi:hypothetical protein